MLPFVDVYGSYESTPTQSLHLSDPSVGSFSAKRLGSRLEAATIGMHLALRIDPTFYFGLDAGLGGGDVGTRVLAPAVATSGPALHAHAGGFIGVTSPRLGAFDVRGEVLVGGRVYLVDLASRNAQLAGDAWMVQPKAIVEARLGPRVTLGAFAASDIVHPGDWATGIFVGIGQRRR